MSILVLLAVVAVGAFLLYQRGEQEGDGAQAGTDGAGTAVDPRGSPSGAVRGTPSVVKQKPVPPSEPVVVESMVAHAEQLNDESATVQDDLSVVGELIAAYIRYIGTGPEGGLNEEFVAALQGSNPMKLILLGKDHARVNEAGELLDRFGTPYYFHPVSAKEIEIRSAGPDKLLWSKDDVLLD
ncbi:MAG: hypothetical protein HKN82_03235 [Akkermansiaceae bacterium]|nr:hypothetical protein [Akkermansiaceae bacterium]